MQVIIQNSLNLDVCIICTVILVSYMYLSLNLLQCTMCTFLHAIYSMYAFPFAVVFEQLNISCCVFALDLLQVMQVHLNPQSLSL